MWAWLLSKLFGDDDFGDDHGYDTSDPNWRDTAREDREHDMAENDRYEEEYG